MKCLVNTEASVKYILCVKHITFYIEFKSFWKVNINILLNFIIKNMQKVLIILVNSMS